MEAGLIFYLLLLLVAFLYAAVGHGGASGYLALMSLFAFAPEVMRPTALVLNIFVSLIAFIHYYRAGHFQWRLFAPFAAASIPASFLGGMITLGDDLYRQLLGVFLLFAVLRMLLGIRHGEKITRDINQPLAYAVGGIIGFASGLLGIGGGIILSPVILLLHWAGVKRTAAISALFILVNSISGLSGQLISGVTFYREMWLMVTIAFAGGFVGAYIGAKRSPPHILRILLALVLLFASFKLILAL